MTPAASQRRRVIQLIPTALAACLVEYVFIFYDLLCIISSVPCQQGKFGETQNRFADKIINRIEPCAGKAHRPGECMQSPNETCQPTSLNLPTMEEALKSPIGRKGPRLMREIATAALKGKTRQEIAKEFHLSGADVDAALDSLSRALRCQKPRLATRRALTHGKSKFHPFDGTPKSAVVAKETRCIGCDARIEEGEPRFVLAAFEIGREVDAEYGWDAIDVVTSLVPRAFHFCHACARKESVQVSDPWGWAPIQNGPTAEEIAGFQKELEAHQREEAAAAAEKDAALAQAVTAGDMHAFSKAMPTTASKSDVMSRATVFSRVVIKESDGDGGSLRLNASEVADVLANTDTPDSLQTWDPKGSAAAGEARQRQKVLEYLNSQRSRDRFLPHVRKALRMWAEGANQAEAAKSNNIDQGNFCRVWKAKALRLAHNNC